MELSHSGHSYVRRSWSGVSSSMRASHIGVPHFGHFGFGTSIFVGTLSCRRMTHLPEPSTGGSAIVSQPPTPGKAAVGDEASVDLDMNSVELFSRYACQVDDISQRRFRTAASTRQLIEMPSFVFTLAIRFLRFAISSNRQFMNLIAAP